MAKVSAKEKRQAQVEAVLLEKPWTRHLSHQLADMLGTSVRTIQQDRVDILARWKADADRFDRADAKAVYLRRLQSVQAKLIARNGKGDSNAAARLFELEADIRGLKAPVEIDLNATLGSPAEALADLVGLLQAVPAPMRAALMTGHPVPELQLLPTGTEDG